MRCTFSEDREARKDIESRVMPRNSMEVVGPEVFSSDRGMPRSAKYLYECAQPVAGG